MGLELGEAERVRVGACGRDESKINSVYGDIHLGNLVENAVLALSALNSEGRVLGFLALYATHHPPAATATSLSSFTILPAPHSPLRRGGGAQANGASGLV